MELLPITKIPSWFTQNTVISYLFTIYLTTSSLYDIQDRHPVAMKINIIKGGGSSIKAIFCNTTN